MAPGKQRQSGPQLLAELGPGRQRAQPSSLGPGSQPAQCLQRFPWEVSALTKSGEPTCMCSLALESKKKAL